MGIISGAVSAESSPKPTLTFTDSAQKVLEEFGGGKPMHYSEIAARAIEQGWLATSGKTPGATLNASVIAEIARQKKRGELPRFVQHGGGDLGLTKWAQTGLEFDIQKHNDEVADNLFKSLLDMAPKDFELLLTRLLVELGFENVEVTNYSGDGGVDVRGTLVVGDAVRLKMAVQAKKWSPSRKIQAPIVQQVRGSLGVHEQGLVITTSDFSKGAVEEAAKPDKSPIALMNGRLLVKQLIAHNIGVTRSNYDVLEIDDNPLV
jgi:restriction system protein